MTFDDLATATGSTSADAIKYCDWLNAAMERYNITTQRQKAAFIGGTVAIESQHLSKVEESLYYKDAQRTANIYARVFNGDPAKAEPYLRNSAKLGQLLYQGYWGRGLIQLTWLSNYQAFKDATGIDVVSDPSLLLDPETAALSAAWFFAEFKDCLTPADAGDMTEVTRRVNGKALMHLVERQAGYKLAMTVAL